MASAVGRRLPDLHGRVVQREAAPAAIESLSRVHTLAYLEHLEVASAEAATRGTQVLAGPETPLSGASWQAILGSTGAALEAVEAVGRGELRNAFVATRPPGHHASVEEAMGFCAVNHVAVAARHLQASGLAQRVAIVDWDVHHGNGTQDIFYEDGSVYYLSLHQALLFPGTGAAEERGESGGVGATLNVPLPAGLPREEHLRRFREAVERAGREFDPEFILVSAGYDALALDPLGDLRLEPGDFGPMTRTVTEWAERACSGRVVALLEGGYEPARTGEGVVATLLALSGAGDTT